MAEELQGLVDRTKLPHPEVIEVSVDGHVGLIEMNEPERMNPLGVNEMHIHYALLDLHAKRWDRRRCSGCPDPTSRPRRTRNEE